MLRFDNLPVHPLTVHFPIALLPVSLLWDGLGLWLGTSLWWTMSFWTLSLGLVAALPAILTGFVEFARLPSGTPADRPATRHLMLTGGAVTFFLVSLLARGGPDEPEGARLLGALVCSGVGVGLLAAGGHLGARLVYRYGVGVGASSESE